MPWRDFDRIRDAAKAVHGEVVRLGPAKPLSAPAPAAAPKRAGKFEQVKLDSVWGDDFVTTNAVVAHEERVTLLFDCGRWPPKKVRIGRAKAHVVRRPSGAGEIYHRVFHRYVEGAFRPEAEGVLVVRDDEGDTDLLARLPDGFDVRDAGFVGDLVVLLPTEPTVRGGHATRPLVWDGKKLGPARGLPDAVPAEPKGRDKFPSFLRQGFARTGAGRDVLVWEGAAWVRKGARFEKASAISHVAVYEVFRGAPLAGDAFVYVARTAPRRSELREVRLGEGERTRVKLDHVLEVPVPGVGGAIVFGVNRYAQPEAPVLFVWHPETNEVTAIPPTAFGVPRDEPAKAYGVGGGSDPYLWILDGYKVKRIPWSVVLALPRTT